MFHRKVMSSHLLGEAICFSIGSILADKTPASMIATVGNNEIKHDSAMQVLIADGEGWLGE